MDLIKAGAIAIAFTFLACERPEVPAECLAVPEASKVEIVKVSVLNPDGTSKRSYQIDTRPRVEELVEAVRANSGGQCKTFEKERPQDLAVSFSTYDSVPLILWIGPDWIGGVDETKKDRKGWLISRWRPMDPSEREQLLVLLREETPLGN